MESRLILFISCLVRGCLAHLRSSVHIPMTVLFSFCPLCWIYGFFFLFSFSLFLTFCLSIVGSGSSHFWPGTVNECGWETWEMTGSWR